MKIAWASPVPPASSGIADYSAELLPPVRRLVELDVFFEGTEAPDPATAGRFRCHPVSELASKAGEYDVVVYHIGNHSKFHGETWRTAIRIPGVVVLHEFVVHDLVREITLVKGDLPAYLDELRYSAGESGRRAAQDVATERKRLDPARYPFFERIVDRSHAVLVHSEFARRRILESRPLAHVELIPMPSDVDSLRPPTPDERARARRELGVEEGAILFGSFGFVTPQKHLEPALAAFAELRRGRPDSRLVVVGEIQRGYDLAAIVRASGADGVHVTGRVPLEEMHRWMAAVDVAISLRYPTGGETSAAILRLFALGVPTVVSREGSFAELPPGTCFPVDVDETEPEMLVRLFEKLAEDPELRAAASREARRCAVEKHAPAIVARTIVDRLQEVVARGGSPRQAVPPLAPWSPPNLPVELLEKLGAAAADLGVGENDELLEKIATGLVELGLDRA